MAPNSKKVIKYNAYWNAEQNKGGIYMFFEDESKLHWKSNDKTEYIIILQILQHDNDPYLFSDGTIATGPEDPGIDTKS